MIKSADFIFPFHALLKDSIRPVFNLLDSLLIGSQFLVMFWFAKSDKVPIWFLVPWILAQILCHGASYTFYLTETYLFESLFGSSATVTVVTAETCRVVEESQGTNQKLDHSFWDCWFAYPSQYLYDQAKPGCFGQCLSAKLFSVTNTSGTHPESENSSESKRNSRK